MKKLSVEDYKATGTTKLRDIPTVIKTKASDKKIMEKTDGLREENSKFQEQMYAHKRHSVLICLQGMDTSGKDGLIREVFKDFNMRGVVVSSFKKPTENELLRNYLWRHYLALPEKGKFGVFNRSHYENVLVSRVHPEILLNEKLPGIEKVEDIPDDFWEQRFRQINEFEASLSQTGTIIIKMFLHISKEEQRKRLLDRLHESDKLWKFSAQDMKERNYWEAYMENYEKAIQNTSTNHAPWYVLPADDKKISRLLAAQIINETLKKYKDCSTPDADPVVEANRREYIGILESE